MCYTVYIMIYMCLIMYMDAYNINQVNSNSLMDKPRLIMLDFHLLCFWALLKKLPIMSTTTAIMPQFIYNFDN